MRKNLSTADKREREKQVVDLMIALYCRKKHHTAKDERITQAAKNVTRTKYKTSIKLFKVRQ